MSKLSKYNNFLLEKQFQNIIDDIFFLVEKEGKWTSSNTYEWDFEQDNSIKGRLKSFLSKLPKDKIKSYYYKFIDNLKSLPEKIRRKLIISYTAIFLGFVSVSFLLPSGAEAESLSTQVKQEVLSALGSEKEEVEIKKSSFDEAQGIVKQVEAGYSSDKGDTGNWIKVPGGKRFIGTNHGISAPILADYLGKLPTKEDMMNLSYETALDIYKKNYWDKHNLGEYTNQSVANIIYDGVVNQGETGTRSVLRKALNENGIEITDDDNPFNVDWIEKSNNLDQKKFFKSIKKFRKERYKESKTFKRHGKGWLKRLNSMKYLKESFQEDIDDYLFHLQDDGFVIEKGEDYVRIFKPKYGDFYSATNLEKFSFSEIAGDIERFVDYIGDEFNGPVFSEHSYTISGVTYITESPRPHTIKADPDPDMRFINPFDRKTISIEDLLSGELNFDLLALTIHVK